MPLFIANSNGSAIEKLLFFRPQWAATRASVVEIWGLNFYGLSYALKLDISDITHTHLHIYFNCCSLELVLLESHLGAEMHETSSTLKFDTEYPAKILIRSKPVSAYHQRKR